MKDKREKVLKMVQRIGHCVDPFCEGCYALTEQIMSLFNEKEADWEGNVPVVGDSEMAVVEVPKQYLGKTVKVKVWEVK